MTGNAGAAVGIRDLVFGGTLLCNLSAPIEHWEMMERLQEATGELR